MGGMGRILAGLVTLAALAAGGVYLVNLVERGNFERGTIRLNVRFDDAHGVAAGGKVRHKGVQVGEVLRVEVAPDDSAVIMELAVRGRFAHTLRRSTRFWIVRPRFGGLTQGIRGLDTLIKDPYVEYDTPDLGAPLLPSGSVVYGMNAAPAAEEGLFHRQGAGRPPVTFSVRFPRSHGLHEGARLAVDGAGHVGHGQFARLLVLFGLPQLAVYDRAVGAVDLETGEEGAHAARRHDGPPDRARRERVAGRDEVLGATIVSPDGKLITRAIPDRYHMDSVFVADVRPEKPVGLASEGFPYPRGESQVAGRRLAPWFGCVALHSGFSPRRPELP